MRRFSVLAAAVIVLVSLGAFAKPAAAICGPNCADNGGWTTQIAGPAMAVVGQQVTYTLTFTHEGIFQGCFGVGTPCAHLAIPAGATNIAIVVVGDAGNCSGTTFAAGPATFTCPNVVFTADSGITFQQATWTVTLTLGQAAAGAFTLQYSDYAAATFTTAVTTVGGQYPNNTFTPTGPPHLNFSGQAYDPRCEYGCPPNGLP